MLSWPMNGASNVQNSIIYWLNYKGNRKCNNTCLMCIDWDFQYFFERKFCEFIAVRKLNSTIMYLPLEMDASDPTLSLNWLQWSIKAAFLDVT